MCKGGGCIMCKDMGRKHTCVKEEDACVKEEDASCV